MIGTEYGSPTNTDLQALVAKVDISDAGEDAYAKFTSFDA